MNLISKQNNTNNISKLIKIFFLLIVVISCDKKDNSEDFEVFEDGSSTEEIYDFGLSNSVIDFKYPFRKFNSDSSLIYFIGLKESKIHFECFEYKTKDNLLSWTELEKAETSLSIDLGFGDIQSHNIENHSIEQVSYKNNSHIIILNESGTTGLLRSNLYFISNNNFKKEKTIAFRAENQSSPIYYSRIMDWYDNSILVLPTDPVLDPYRAEFKCFCFTTGGDLIYETKLLPYQTSYDYSFAISFEEYVQLETIYISGVCERSFVRKNAKTGETIWSNKLSELSKSSNELTIKNVNTSQFNSGFVIFDVSCILPNGEESFFKFKIDIESGSFVKE